MNDCSVYEVDRTAPDAALGAALDAAFDRATSAWRYGKLDPGKRPAHRVVLEERP